MGNLASYIRSRNGDGGGGGGGNWRDVLAPTSRVRSRSTGAGLKIDQVAVAPQSLTEQNAGAVERHENAVRTMLMETTRGVVDIRTTENDRVRAYTDFILSPDSTNDINEAHIRAYMKHSMDAHVYECLVKEILVRDEIIPTGFAKAPQRLRKTLVVRAHAASAFYTPWRYWREKGSLALRIVLFIIVATVFVLVWHLSRFVH